MAKKQEKLFREHLIPSEPGTGRLFDVSYDDEDKGPVTCLGMTFKDDDARRTHFIEELRKKLQDPEFRKIEGFPIGSDEDILNLSDPPYYTACPNPWITDFVKEWESKKPKQLDGYKYIREPYAADVTEGKNDLVYRIPSYHTKVPPKAIEKYVLHYTDPGDIVLDGFSGSGMLGVACTHQKYRSHDRHAIMIDLSPFATFMSSVMCSPLVPSFKNDTLHNWLIENIEPMYRSDKNNPTKSFEYAVWSYWGKCPECDATFRLYDLIVDYKNEKLRDKYNCPQCNVEIKSRKQEKYFVTEYDHFLKEPHSMAKSSMVLISGKDRNRTFRRECDSWDIDLYEKSILPNSHYSPTEIPFMHMTHERNNLPKYWGITHINHFYTDRNYSALSKLCSISDPNLRRTSLFCATRALYRNFTRRNRFHVYKYSPKGSPIGPLSNTLYVPTLQVEANVSIKAREALNLIQKQAGNWTNKHAIVSTQSITEVPQIESNTIDFIFTDPPFGGNINYSEQNYLIEWWLKVFTNNKREAITNTVQKKGVKEYQELMTLCFKEYYRILKPGRWMVVEFHNSANSIWAAIQLGLEVAGFVVATVDVLDKVHSTLHQDHKAAAVDKDLAITVYKPGVELEKQFTLDQGTEAGVWDFINHHLLKLPVFLKKGGNTAIIPERMNYLLFDRMVAYHVQRGVTVPLSSAEFYAGLDQKFSKRDGMYFLPSQVAEYDKKRMTTKEVMQLKLFIIDESSAIQWLRQQLYAKPQTAGELKPPFMQEIGGWQKNEKLLELDDLLDQNFLRYNAIGPVPEQIHSYLSSNWKDLRNLSKTDPALIAKAKDRWYVPDPTKAGDIEKLREKTLLKEFEMYQRENKKLKIFRMEALRAGFKKAYQDRDYTTIIAVAEKIPDNILEEDPKLLMWYDQAVTRSSIDKESLL